MSDFKKTDAKKITVIGMFIAISFVVTMLSKLLPPIFSATPFLTLDFKDAFVIIAGFMYGPVYALIIAVAESVIEMITISSTGFIGLIMNILSTAVFAVVGSAIYSFRRTIKGAVVGLTVGILSMTVMMMLWNYIFTPMYMGVDRQVIKSLLPIIIAFNVIKGVLNSAVALLLYKRVIFILSKAGFMPNHQKSSGKINAVTIVCSVILIIGCVIIIFLV
ncbi:MAG: ECF transporter S component [Acutalibacteraceae bacterium]|nr:ECF transporter S component [Acutalibacteraceae bacterium]